MSGGARLTDMLKTHKWFLAIAGISVVVFLLAGGFAMHHLRIVKEDLRHKQVIDKAIRTIPFHEKIDILRRYIRSTRNPRFIGEAQQLLNKFTKREMENELSVAGMKAEALIQSGHWQEAFSPFKEMEQKYRDSPFLNQIKQKEKKICELIDENAYDSLLQKTGKMGPESVTLYQEFLNSNPESSYRKELENKIASMEQEYYAYIEEKLREREKLKDWDGCLRLSQQFIDQYPHSAKLDALDGYRRHCREKIEADEALAGLSKQAETLANDYTGIVRLYADYFKANPQTPAKKEVEQKITAFQALAKKKRIATEREKMTALIQDQGTRFKVHDDGTVSDTQTGLMWCLIDSRAQLDKCLDFNAAKSFVKALDTGGHRDWRLPDKTELTALYHTSPGFPSTEPTWYWTNRTYKSYQDRWVIEVEVVSTVPNADEKSSLKGDWMCGAVRAVRGGQHP
jgi:Protein of unknown function (DUF1566)